MTKIDAVATPNQDSQAHLEQTRNEGKLKISGREYSVNTDLQGITSTHPQRKPIANFFGGVGKLFAQGNSNPAAQAATERPSPATSALQRSLQSGIGSASRSSSSATGAAQGRSHAEGASKPEALNIECTWNSKEHNLQIENPECRKIILALHKQDSVVVQSNEKPGKEYAATLENGRCVIRKQHNNILGAVGEKFVEHNFTKALEEKLNTVLAREEVLSDYPKFEKYGRYVDAFKDIADAIDMPKDKTGKFSQILLEMSELHADISNKFSSASDLGELQGLRLRAGLAGMIKKIEGAKNLISDHIQSTTNKGEIFKKDATLSRSSAIVLKDVIGMVKNDSNREFESAREALLKRATNEKVISKINEIDELKTEAENGYEAATGWIDEFLKSSEARLQLSHKTSPLSDLPKQTVGNVFLAAHSLDVLTTLLEGEQSFEYRALMRIKGSPANQKFEKLNSLANFVQNLPLSGRQLNEFKNELTRNINDCTDFFKGKSMISGGHRTQALENLSDWVAKFRYGQAPE